MKRVNFNGVAPFYDRLAKLVFRSAMRLAQKQFLPEIIRARNILIIGGGTGLLFVDFLRSTSGKITYVDSSEKMIALARNNFRLFNERVTFICGTEEKVPEEVFDAVILNFYLDLFSETSMQRVTKLITGKLKSEAQLVVTDFVKQDIVWQKLLLWLMYLFFRVTCNIEAKQLPDWPLKLHESGFQLIKSKSFFYRFIESRLYQYSQ